MKLWYYILIGGILVYGYRRYKNYELSEVQLSTNFSLDEFVTTQTGLENIPGKPEIENIRALVVNVLQPLRTYFNKVMTVHNGYRSPMVNIAVRGAANSQHLDGSAADIDIEGVTNQQIINAARLLKLPYDQIIDEQKDGQNYVHISHKRLGKNRIQWLTARNAKDGSIVYLTVKTGTYV